MEGHKEEHELVTGDDCEAIVDELVEEIKKWCWKRRSWHRSDWRRNLWTVIYTLGDIARNDEGDDDESRDNDGWKENMRKRMLKGNLVRMKNQAIKVWH